MANDEPGRRLRTLPEALQGYFDTAEKLGVDLSDDAKADIKAHFYAGAASGANIVLAAINANRPAQLAQYWMDIIEAQMQRISYEATDEGGSNGKH
ncbi:MAG: hypothetical protein HC889_00515 [Synechococcaceae cyanobacterium SM1_2_3]|nr:hypothetical protein [Synechococcaceae cyanobacterium SM1_2_3]